MISLRAAILPVFLMSCLVLGGASAGGYPANLVLQFVGIGLIIWALASKPTRHLWREERRLIAFVGAGLLIIVLQFLPLPLTVWEALPQRGGIAAAARLAGVEPVPVFLSLMPHESLKSAIWLLPAFGLLIAMLRAQAYDPRHLAWVIVLAVMVSVLVGALQLAGGQRTEWYFYRITNSGSTVGFFANSNHLATLLLVALPFLAALTASSERRRAPARAATLGVAGASLGVSLMGIFVNGSLFGYGLVLPVFLASLLILTPRADLRRMAAALLVPSVALGIVLVLATAEGQAMLAESSRLSTEGRGVIFANSWKAIADFMPAGSGLGSFAEIYRLYEDPAEVGPVYVNHAHNDYLELLLETGLLGGLALVAFLVWWSWRAFRIWHAKRMDPFAGAAVIASAVILVHSIVDYPLRTVAISCVFAICLALMAVWMEGDPLYVVRRGRENGDKSA